MGQFAIVNPTAPNTVAWGPLKDYQLLGLVSVATAIILISRDPSVTTAAFKTPTVLGTDSNIVFGTNGSPVFPAIPIPIEGGTTYYVAFAGKDTAILFLSEFS